MPGVEIAGIVGRQETKVTQVANSLGIPGLTDRWRILDDDTVDAVDICYPTFVHREYVTSALQRGKHVLCETPLALTLEDADAMIAAARSNGKLLLVALVMRFVDAYTYIYDTVRAGDLGKPLVACTTRLAASRDRSRRPSAEFGEPVVELMIHDFDCLNWLLGKPIAVSSTGLMGPTGEVDYAFIWLEYESMRGQVEGSVLMPTTYPFSTSLRVLCEEGVVETSFRVHGAGRLETILTRYPRAGSPEVPNIPDEDPYWTECRYFVDGVSGKADPSRISVEAGRDGLQVALAAKLSLERGGEQVTLA
jgi:predicted dehydrogenase